MAAKADPDRFDDLFAPFGKILVRRMFGAEGLFRDGLMFGMVYRGTDLSQNQRRKPPSLYRRRR